MEVISTKMPLEMIQKVQIRVSPGFSVAVPGTTILDTAVSRIGATTIPITGITPMVSASFSSRSLVDTSI